MDVEAFEAEARGADVCCAASRVYGTSDSLEHGAAFRALRGHEPTVEPILRERGLVDA